MPSIDELVSTPQFQAASERRREKMFVRFTNSASDEARSAMIAKASTPLATPITTPVASAPQESTLVEQTAPQPVATPSPSTVPTQAGPSSGVVARTPTPIPRQAPVLAPPAPGRQMEDAPWFAPLAGDMAIATGAALAAPYAAPVLGLPQIAAHAPKIVKMLREGAAFAGLDLAGRRGLRGATGSPQHSLMDEALTTTLDVLAPTVGEYAVKPAAQFVGRTLKRAVGLPVRAAERAAVMTPLQHNREILETSVRPQTIQTLLDARTSVLGVEKKVAKDVLKTAARNRRDDVRNLVGPNPRDEARINAPVGTPEGVIARNESVGVYENLVNDVQERFGREYEALFPPEMYDNLLSPSQSEQLGATAKELLSRAPQFKIDPKALKILDDVAKYAPKDAIEGDAVEALIAAQRSGATPDEIRRMSIDIAKSRRASTSTDDLPPLKLGDILHLKRELPQFMVEVNATRHVAKRMSMGITDILSESNVVNRELNARYRDWKLGYDRKTMSSLWGAQRAPELDSLLGETKLTRAILRHADPTQKQNFRKTISDIAATYTDQKLGDIRKMIPPDIASDLYGAAAAPVNRWSGVDLQIDNLPRVMNADPTLLDLYNRNLAAGREMVFRKYSSQTREDVAKALDQLGSAGQQRAHELRTMSPEEGMNAAIATLNDPQAFDKLLAQTSEDIPINMGKSSSAMWEKRLGYGVVGGLIFNATTGTSPAYTMGMAGVSGGILAAQHTRRMMIKMLESPTYGKLLTLFDKPWTRSTIAHAGRVSGQLIAVEAMEKLGRTLVPGDADASMNEQPLMSTSGAEAALASNMRASEGLGDAGAPVGASIADAAPVGAVGAPQMPMNGAPASNVAPQLAQGPQNAPFGQNVPQSGNSMPPPPGGGGADAGPSQAPTATARDEFTRHNIETPTFKRFHLGGTLIETPRLVTQYQQLVNKGIEARVSALAQIPQYRFASPSVQQRMIRDTIETSKKSALGAMRPEIGRQLKKDSRDRAASRKMEPSVVP